MLHALFVGYAGLFTRITQAIARAQELAADRLAATITSSRDAAAALVLTRRAAYGYRGFLDGELGPVIVRGFRPPFANGFSAFLGAQSTKLDEAVADAMVYEVTFEEDSHPPLRERLEALGEPNPDRWRSRATATPSSRSPLPSNCRRASSPQRSGTRSAARRDWHRATALT